MSVISPADDIPGFFADGGAWLVGDTVSEYPECGQTPNTAEILMWEGSKSLKLTSGTTTVGGCLDNIWAVLFTELHIPGVVDQSISIPITNSTVISFKETGNLISPATGSPYCVLPPCGDTASLTIEDTRGNMLAYLLQRAPGAVPNDVHSWYREVFLDPNAGTYSRNLFADFNTIPDFNPSGATIRTVAFQVSEHGTATIDNICIGTSGCVPPPVVTVPDVVSLTQSAAKEAIELAGLSMGSVTTQNSIEPAGTVINQAPVAGTKVFPGTEVDLIVSSGALIPSANFSADSKSGTTPFGVNFTDQSIGTITSWNWNFGDGASSALQHPFHVYTREGNYNVALTVSGPAGSDIETKTNYILTTQTKAEKAKIQVAAGANYSVGLKSDGSLMAVGANGSGQSNVRSWTDIVAVAAGGSCAAVVAGGSHTVGLKSDGTVVAVGDNLFGQLDVGSWSGIVQVAAGVWHTVGLKSDGTVVAVGSNSFGQLNVDSWDDIVQVAAGGFHTVGLKSDGTVVAVGSNKYGQLNVGYWADIMEVAAGSGHTVAMKADGTVVAAGANGSGQCNTYDWILILKQNNINNTLADAILVLQIISGGGVTDISILKDINNDGKIGLEEAIFALQAAAGLR